MCFAYTLYSYYIKETVLEVYNKGYCNFYLDAGDGNKIYAYCLYKV